MNNLGGGTGGFSTPQNHKALKLQHFNHTMTNPNLRPDHFVKSFNHMIRTEFFENAQKRSLRPKEQRQLEFSEFPSTKLMDAYVTYRNDTNKPLKPKDSSQITNIRLKHLKKLVFQERHKNSIGLPNSIFAGQSPVTRVVHASERVKKLSLYYQKILSKAKSSNEFANLLTNLPLLKLISETKEKENSGSVTDEESPVTLHKSPKRLEKTEQPIAPFRVKHVRTMSMTLQKNKDSEKPNEVLKEGSDSKNNQVREVVNVLNKKLDSMRGHGNGTALVRNLLRNFSKNQACQLSALADSNQTTKAMPRASDPLFTKQSDLTTNFTDRESQFTKMKIDFREIAYRNTEKSIQFLLNNKKRLPKFDFPRLTLNLEINDSHQCKSIDHHTTAKAQAKNEGNSNFTRRSRSYLKLFEEGFQGAMNKENDPTKRLSEMMTARSLNWFKGSPEKKQLEDFKAQMNQKLSELQQKLSDVWIVAPLYNLTFQQ